MYSWQVLNLQGHYHHNHQVMTHLEGWERNTPFSLISHCLSTSLHLFIWPCSNQSVCSGFLADCCVYVWKFDELNTARGRGDVEPPVSGCLKVHKVECGRRRVVKSLWHVAYLVDGSVIACCREPNTHTHKHTHISARNNLSPLR